MKKLIVLFLLCSCQSRKASTDHNASSGYINCDSLLLKIVKSTQRDDDSTKLYVITAKILPDSTYRFKVCWKENGQEFSYWMLMIRGDTTAMHTARMFEDKEMKISVNFCDTAAVSFYMSHCIDWDFKK